MKKFLVLMAVFVAFGCSQPRSERQSITITDKGAKQVSTSVLAGALEKVASSNPKMQELDSEDQARKIEFKSQWVRQNITSLTVGVQLDDSLQRRISLLATIRENDVVPANQEKCDIEISEVSEGVFGGVKECSSFEATARCLTPICDEVGLLLDMKVGDDLDGQLLAHTPVVAVVTQIFELAPEKPVEMILSAEAYQTLSDDQKVLVAGLESATLSRSTISVGRNSVVLSGINIDGMKMLGLLNPKSVGSRESGVVLSSTNSSLLAEGSAAILGRDLQVSLNLNDEGLSYSNEFQVLSPEAPISEDLEFKGKAIQSLKDALK